MEESKQKVRTKFDDNARRYDSQRKQLIPCFDDFYGIAVSLAASEKESPRILDIGAGTGLLSSFLMEKYPKASFTLIDLSEKMLELAKDRFDDNPNVTYLVADYAKYPFAEPFDLIVSSLSIHHLTDPEKAALYRTINNILNDKGIFINADQVLGSTPYLDKMYVTDWKAKVEASGLSAEAIAASYERLKLDIFAPLADQLNWLKQAGFVDVDCVYKYFNFVVLFGRKETA
ncbi:methyltransferase domain-containing protein [Heliobacterium gestii]|uniref:Methyltransferase domain-containing protein n=1 Tax=Heliomicrobium gestii TaxID=2699 RepID=A0A845LCH2_HELGE|nr:class I SAM-dependent methyltransferase [Heliomicrobium gestii]MBM7866923.1 tRNA (cmo5U34)-methyltransferase [Heliomicrobium gestii]MZP42349.1 methyltransferase domain-containing protein [Heliomicrobium gestii]